MKWTIQGDTPGMSLLNIYRVAEQFPRNDFTRPDASLLPDPVAAAYDELEGVRNQSRYAVIACRRILELACAERLANPKATLSERIGQLQAEGVLTKEVADWARALKDVLNGKTHSGEAPSKEQATEVIDLTRLLVELLFVYPERVRSLRHF